MRPFALLAMGASLGGPAAIATVLSLLSGDLSVPIALVQHRRSDDGDKLVQGLQAAVKLPVREPIDKEPMRPGRLYVAPAGYHLLVEPGRFALSLDESVRHARPSIDVLLESVACAYGPAAVGVLLTGQSADGAAGLAEMKRKGAVVAVQDPATAEASRMPRAALDACVPDVMGSPEALASWLRRLLEHEA